MIVVVDLAALGDRGPRCARGSWTGFARFRGRGRASPDFGIVIDRDQPITKSGAAGSPFTKSGAAGSRNRSAKPAFTITITPAWIRHGSFCELSCALAAHKTNSCAGAGVY